MARPRSVDKELMYRSFLPVNLAAHAAHWDGFTWRTGPWVVRCIGDWGRIQVWAESIAEGKRVIRHAASISGWDPDDPSQGTWSTHRVVSPRYGRQLLVQTATKEGVPVVTSRVGPSGLPELQGP